MGKEMPLIFLPGMGADERMFGGVASAVPGIVVPKWIKPLGGESIGEYAGRLAEVIDPGGPCIVGGASFGGFTALELCRYLDVRACFLFGSVRGGDELPKMITSLRKVSEYTNFVPFELLKHFAHIGFVYTELTGRESMKEFLNEFSETDAEFMAWACRAVLEWRGRVETGDVPVYHIHGEKDHVLPVKNTRPDAIIKGAGHIITISHPRQVVEFLQEKLAEIYK